jgi:hypothetical protein
MPLGLAWLLLRDRKTTLWILLAALILGTLRLWIRPSMPVWMPFCSGLGVAVIADVLLWSFRSRSQRRIACALWLLIPLIALPYLQLPVKYLVACAPAAALLIADLLETSRWRTIIFAGLVAAGTIYGCVVLYADNQFAGMPREAAARLVAPHTAAGDRVWLASQWGFYWYAQKAGAKVLWTNDKPVPGDYLVRGQMEGWPETLKRLPPAVLVDTFVVGGPQGRTMSKADNAGLYSNMIGDWIWAWGTGEWNRYELWRFK